MPNGVKERKLRERLVAKNGSVCFYCGHPAKVVHAEHVLARSLGGKTTDQNIVLACIECNCEKSDRTLDSWLKHSRYIRKHVLMYLAKVDNRIKVLNRLIVRERVSKGIKKLS